MGKRTIVGATRRTSEELIPHIQESQTSGISPSELSREIDTAIRVVTIQAIHLQESSTALVCQAERLAQDIKAKLER